MPNSIPTPTILLKRGLPSGNALPAILLQLESRKEYQLARLLTELDNAPEDEFTAITVRANDIAAVVKARLADVRLPKVFVAQPVSIADKAVQNGLSELGLLSPDGTITDLGRSVGQQLLCERL